MDVWYSMFRITPNSTMKLYINPQANLRWKTVHSIWKSFIWGTFNRREIATPPFGWLKKVQLIQSVFRWK